MNEIKTFEENSEIFWKIMDHTKESVEILSAMLDCWEWQFKMKYKDLMKGNYENL